MTTFLKHAGVILIAFVGFDAPVAYAQNQLSPSATVKDGMVHYAIPYDNTLWVAKFDGPNYDTLPRLTFEGKKYGFSIVGENPAKPKLALLHAFSVNSSGNGIHSIYSGTGWGEWKIMYGQFTSRLSSVFYNNKVYVFGRGTDNNLYVSAGTDSTFSDWSMMPQKVFATGAGAASGPDGIRVVATDAQGVVWQSTLNGSSWSSWVSLGCCAHTQSEPAITWSYDKTYDAEIRGTDQALYSKTYAPGGEGVAWSKLPGATQASPSIVRDSIGDQMLVVYGTDGANYYATRKARGGWSGFTPVDRARLAGRYIVDITVVGGTSSAVKCADGWVKNPQDLNAGAGGQYIYACLLYGARSNALKSIGILNRGQHNESQTLNPWYDPNNTRPLKSFSDGCSRGTIVPYDLNKGAGGSYIYFCKSKTDGKSDPNSVTPDFLTDIMFRVSATSWANTEKCGGTAFKFGKNVWQVTWTDWYGSEDVLDLNHLSGGKYIWLCVRGD